MKYDYEFFDLKFGSVINFGHWARVCVTNIDLYFKFDQIFVDNNIKAPCIFCKYQTKEATACELRLAIQLIL